MAKILNQKNVYSFLHVPVQAGSDNVLYDMRREYTADDFRHVVDFLKARLVNHYLPAFISKRACECSTIHMCCCDCNVRYSNS